MLSGLVETVENDMENTIGTPTVPSMGIEDVEEFLEQSKRAV
jgi:hypothetical protein